MRKTYFFITAVFALFTAISSWAAIDALNFQSPQQEDDYHSLTQELRCPQCQNNNIADSNATIAVDMRGKVFELLQEGKTKKEIVDYMVARYGNFVTYKPPVTPATILLWVVPSLLVILGIFIAFRRKPKMAKSYKSAVENTAVLTDELTEQEKQRLKSILNQKAN